jgi:hypothetical protein
MKNTPKQNELWSDDQSSIIQNTVKSESSAMKVRPRKYVLVSVLLIFSVAIGLAFYFSNDPTIEGERMTELQACQKKCAPRFGEIKGERRIPNASQYERRNYEINAKCVCS